MARLFPVVDREYIAGTRDGRDIDITISLRAHTYSENPDYFVILFVDDRKYDVFGADDFSEIYSVVESAIRLSNTVHVIELTDQLADNLLPLWDEYFQ